MNKLTFSVDKKFLAGVLTFWAVSSLQQDYWGLEKTIQHVVSDWIPARYTVPLAIAALAWAGFLSWSAEVPHDR